VLREFLPGVECEHHQAKPIILIDDTAQSSLLGHLDFG
jgi:hypothetical protein